MAQTYSSSEGSERTEPLPRSQGEGITRTIERVFALAWANPAGREGEVEQHLLRWLEEEPKEIIGMLEALCARYPDNRQLAGVFAKAVPRFVYRFADKERQRCGALIDRLALYFDVSSEVRVCLAGSVRNFVEGASEKTPDRCAELLNQLADVHARYPGQVVRKELAEGIALFLQDRRCRRHARAAALNGLLRDLRDTYHGEIALQRAARDVARHSGDVIESGSVSNYTVILADDGSTMARELPQRIGAFLDSIGIGTPTARADLTTRIMDAAKRETTTPHDEAKTLFNARAEFLAPGETTDRATMESRAVTETTSAPPDEVRTAQQLFGVAAAKASKRRHQSNGPEFSDAELLDPVLLAAADKAANDRAKREKNGEGLSPHEMEAALRGGRFAKQARKRQRELGLR